MYDLSLVRNMYLSLSLSLSPIQYLLPSHHLCLPPLPLYFCGKSQQWREIELRLVDLTPHLARVLSLPTPVLPVVLLLSLK